VPAPRFHGWFVVAAAAAVLLFRLGGPALWDDDEPKNAACSLAMLDSGDWVVPTFNGRLRVEKPPLVNWLQIGGYTLCGRNETGARLSSALLTIGTCLLTWRIGCLLLGPAVGLLGGLVMATCVGTAVVGRAATPDAPLTFFTTLAFYLFVCGGGGRDTGCTRLSAWSAAGVGMACGAAVLTKGPVGVVLPLVAFLLFAIWRQSGTAGGWREKVTNLRPLTILCVAMGVALPWYAWVTIRTDGLWLHGFLIVHNVGRFTATMEGHSGSLLYYPGIVAIGLFPWSIVLAAMLAHATAVLRSTRDDDRRAATQLLVCWMLAWIGSFSCAGTKLPGYIWPAYPALAIGTALFLVDWARGRVACFDWCPDPGRASELVMRLAWSILALTGLGFTIGLPIAAAQFAPGGEWLGLFGLIPLVAAWIAWQCQSHGARQWSLATVAGGACLFVTLMASIAAESFSHAQGPRTLVEQLREPSQDCRWACLWNVPPSLVFYTGALIEKLDTAADVADHLLRHPLARVVIDSRQEQLVGSVLPTGCGVLARVPTLTNHDYLLIGRLPLVPDDPPLALLQ